MRARGIKSTRQILEKKNAARVVKSLQVGPERTWNLKGGNINSRPTSFNRKKTPPGRGEQRHEGAVSFQKTLKFYRRDKYESILTDIHEVIEW